MIQGQFTEIFLQKMFFSFVDAKRGISFYCPITVVLNITFAYFLEAFPYYEDLCTEIASPLCLHLFCLVLLTINATVL
jgi:hypothetical protein